MKQMKYILFTFFLFIFSILIYSKDRVPKVPMEQLTNPKSPSYVPIPYPKTREEIITDLKYSVDKLFFHNTKICKACANKFQAEILSKFLNDNHDVIVSKIIKVKNFWYRHPYKYSFTVELINKKDEPLARLCLNSFGLFVGVTFSTEKDTKYRIKRLKGKEEIYKVFSKLNIISLQKRDIKKIEAVVYPHPRISNLTRPAYEIVTNDGQVFYLTERNEIFKLKCITKLTQQDIKTKSYIKSIRQSLVKSNTLVYDSINDQLLNFEKLTEIKSTKE